MTESISGVLNLFFLPVASPSKNPTDTLPSHLVTLYLRPPRRHLRITSPYLSSHQHPSFFVPFHSTLISWRLSIYLFIYHLLSISLAIIGRTGLSCLSNFFFFFFRLFYTLFIIHGAYGRSGSVCFHFMFSVAHSSCTCVGNDDLYKHK